MEIILVLLVLAVIMLVGHALWVMLAWFFGMLAGTSSTVPAGVGRPERCVGCGQRRAPRQEICRECGLELKSQTAAELRELQTTEDLLVKLRDAGRLDPATLECVQNCIAAHR